MLDLKNILFIFFLYNNLIILFYINSAVAIYFSTIYEKSLNNTILHTHYYISLQSIEKIPLKIVSSNLKNLKNNFSAIHIVYNDNKQKNSSSLINLKLKLGSINNYHIINNINSFEGIFQRYKRQLNNNYVNNNNVNLIFPLRGAVFLPYDLQSKQEFGTGKYFNI